MSKILLTYDAYRPDANVFEHRVQQIIRRREVWLKTHSGKACLVLIAKVDVLTYGKRLADIGCAWQTLGQGADLLPGTVGFAEMTEKET